MTAQLVQCVLRHRLGRLCNGVRLQLETNFGNLFELLPSELWRRSITEKMRLRDEPVRLKAAQCLANRRLGNAQLAGEAIHGDPCAGRDLQRKQLRKQSFVDALA